MLWNILSLLGDGVQRGLGDIRKGQFRVLCACQCLCENLCVCMCALCVCVCMSLCVCVCVCMCVSISVCVVWFVNTYTCPALCCPLLLSHPKFHWKVKHLGMLLLGLSWGWTSWKMKSWGMVGTGAGPIGRQIGCCTICGLWGMKTSR